MGANLLIKSIETLAILPDSYLWTLPSLNPILLANSNNVKLAFFSCCFYSLANFFINYFFSHGECPPLILIIIKLFNGSLQNNRFS